MPGTRRKGRQVDSPGPYVGPLRRGELVVMWSACECVSQKNEPELQDGSHASWRMDPPKRFPTHVIGNAAGARCSERREVRAVTSADCDERGAQCDEPPTG